MISVISQSIPAMGRITEIGFFNHWNPDNE